MLSDNGGQEMARMSAPGKKRRQRWTRICKGGYGRDSKDIGDGGGGTMLVALGENNGDGLRRWTMMAVDDGRGLRQARDESKWQTMMSSGIIVK